MCLSSVGGIKRSFEGEGRFGVTVAAKARVRVLFIAERLLKLKISLLSNYPKRRRHLIEARGASPLMRERRSNH
jgi:hypothetical protein